MYRDQSSPGFALARGDRGTWGSVLITKCSSSLLQLGAQAASAPIAIGRFSILTITEDTRDPCKSRPSRRVRAPPRPFLHDASATAPTMPPSTPSQADVQSRDGAAEGPDPRVGQACLACRRKKVAQVDPISRRRAHSLTCLRSNATGSSRVTSAVLASRTASIPGAGTMRPPADSMRTPVEPVS